MPDTHLSKNVIDVNSNHLLGLLEALHQVKNLCDSVVFTYKHF